MKPGKNWTLALLVGPFLVSANLQAVPCAPSSTVLCLSGQRFAVEVNWKDFQGNTGQGRGVTLTPDTGYFWFFSDNNVELVVKVLDARSFNNHFWVFFGALSNVEYGLKVTDTATGRTKTYQNPSGRFASVGDTAAFTGTAGGAAATYETVETEGMATPPGSLAAIQRFLEAAEAKSASRGSARNAAVTPCPGTPRILSLSNCRFHLEVEWTDPQGRTGIGQAVQLTNDTGYFWFFSDNNVELIVKVLDARAFNGNFWVFYGALSNVRYSISLTDSVTGAFKTYGNPSGTFASVGDTSAFRGGRSVAPVLDTAHAASANLDERGGSVTATGADGTVFTLELPPRALPSPEIVTLTPVSRIDRFPFSGGLVAGIEIEPSRLDLMVPATLTIRPASPPPANRTLPFSYSRGGEDFILYPRDLDTSTIRLPLVTFAGYGVGQGDAADAAAQTDKIPSGPLTPYLQRYAREVFLRVLGQISQAELLDRAIRIYQEAFDEVVAPLLGLSGVGATSMQEVECPFGTDARRNEAERQGLWTLFAGIRQIQMLPFLAEAYDWGNGIDHAKEILRACLEDSFERCVSRNDPWETLLMVQIARQLELLGVEDPLLTSFTEHSYVERCLRFELDFESTIVLKETTPNAGATTRLKYRAPNVPLRFSYGGNLHSDSSIWEGSCSLRAEAASVELSVDLAAAGCTLTADGGKGTFTAAAAWIGVLEDSTTSPVKLLYHPGNPQAKATLSCEDGTRVDFPVLQWPVEYLALHQNESWPTQVGNGYMARDWTRLFFGAGHDNPDFFAMKSYKPPTLTWRPNLTLTEETWIFLKHTPDKAMPDCP